ncbi:MAG: hypothetical protein QOK22_2405 [Gaiellaceae bacterium]|jgi:DNA repair exonuclease SbcCD ATPase subunit|nr:hypothetical protein [Gaiellaceae bacterium]
MDSWEESFDTWVPGVPQPPGAPTAKAGGAAEDTGTDLDRAELLRLARELAERRQAGRTSADTEVEQLKQELRERAASIAARERELEALQRRLESGRPAIRGKLELRTKRSDRHDPGAGKAGGDEALAARERATLERARLLAERERDAEAREQAAAEAAARLEAEAARIAQRERELAAELAAAQAKLAETDSERELTRAERERLEERDRAVHEVEKELAAARMELERERQALEARAGELGAKAAALDQAAEKGTKRATQQLVEQAGAAERDATTKLAGVGERERALASREAKLEARERDLGLMRQGLDAERNALLERERALRRREIADVRGSFEPPLVPPSFSEGLAALARSRSRG